MLQALTCALPSPKANESLAMPSTIVSLRNWPDTKLPVDQKHGTRRPSEASSHSNGWITCGWSQITASAPWSARSPAQ